MTIEPATLSAYFSTLSAGLPSQTGAPESLPFVDGDHAFA